jgi:hypothetical protein
MEFTMTNLKIDLPDDIFWLTERVQSLVKPAAFLREDSTHKAVQGSTRAWGLPDLPKDTDWLWCLNQHPDDGESFYLQLNLAEIPDAVRNPVWPAVGVVWVFINLSDGWNATARFDSRPSSEIPWRPRLDKTAPFAAQWTIAHTVPDCTNETLPEIEPVPAMSDAYFKWATDHYLNTTPSEVQIGGWIWPCQGWFDAHNKDVVCALENLEFGDAGAVYLHYTVERGFYARVTTH